MDTDIYICGHTRKCGWNGTGSKLVQVPDVKFNKRNGIYSTRGTCPKCGGLEFYIRQQPQTKQKDQQ